MRLAFTLRPRRFVDLDTLVETALAGLRDAGALRRGAPDLDVVLATKATGATATAPTGLRVDAVAGAALRAQPHPGPALLDAGSAALPGARREGKRAWREVLHGAWRGRGPLGGEVWAEVALAVPGSIVAPLEPILDALEPVLGRDPRGRDWQEFFPADDRITWLRVRRDQRPGAPALRLVLGPVTRSDEHRGAVGGLRCVDTRGAEGT
jgi:hypothetical protein